MLQYACDATVSIFPGRNIFKDEQIVMPESIDSMVKLLGFVPGHDKPSLATRLKLRKITKNGDNFTELYSRFVIQKT